MSKFDVQAESERKAELVSLVRRLSPFSRLFIRRSNIRASSPPRLSVARHCVSGRLFLEPLSNAALTTMDNVLGTVRAQAWTRVARLPAICYRRADLCGSWGTSYARGGGGVSNRYTSRGHAPAGLCTDLQRVYKI